MGKIHFFYDQLINIKGQDHKKNRRKPESYIIKIRNDQKLLPLCSHLNDADNLRTTFRQVTLNLTIEKMLKGDVDIKSQQQNHNISVQMQLLLQPQERPAILQKGKRNTWNCG